MNYKHAIIIKVIVGQNSAYVLEHTTRARLTLLIERMDSVRTFVRVNECNEYTCMQDTFARARTRPLGQARARR